MTWDEVLNLSDDVVSVLHRHINRVSAESILKELQIETGQHDIEERKRVLVELIRDILPKGVIQDEAITDVVSFHPMPKKPPMFG